MARIDDFQALLVDRLMPPGSLLTRRPDSNLGRLGRAPATELARLEALAEFVVADLVPDATTLFLADWERTLGLPDCDVVPGSTAEQLARVAEKLTRGANLTLALIQGVLDFLGFDAVVTETATAHQFQVTVATIVPIEFEAGVSTAGDRLGAFGLDSLECILDAIKPHHTTYLLTVP